MRVMLLDGPRRPLREAEVPVPSPGPGQLLLRVRACAVCRTDLHVVDGELADTKLPLVPGHEVVGEVAALGAGVEGFAEGDRVGVPWLGWTCGECRYCRSGRENLCARARSPATPSMADTRSTRSPTRATASRCRRATRTRRPRPCCARG